MTVQDSSPSFRDQAGFRGSTGRTVSDGRCPFDAEQPVCKRDPVPVLKNGRAPREWETDERFEIIIAENTLGKQGLVRIAE